MNGFQFELTCPRDGAAVELESAEEPTVWKATANLLCTECGFRFVAAVYLESDRLPYKPLEQFGNRSELAKKTGMPRRSLLRYSQRGLPIPAADEIAVALGLHPCELWPDWFEMEDEVA